MALRQFGKGSMLNSSLKALQQSIMAQRDEISDLVIDQLKRGFISSLKANPIPDFQQLTNISSHPINVFLKPASNAARMAIRHGCSSLYSV